jgi:hypothetical protein
MVAICDARPRPGRESADVTHCVMPSSRHCFKYYCTARENMKSLILIAILIHSNRR